MYSPNKMSGMSDSSYRNRKFIDFIVGALFCLLLYFTFIYRSEVIELREKNRYNTFLFRKTKVALEKAQDELKICKSQRKSVDSAVLQLQSEARTKDAAVKEYQTKMGKSEQLSNLCKDFFDNLKITLFGANEEMSLTKDDMNKITNAVEKLKEENGQASLLKSRLDKLTSGLTENEKQVSNFAQQKKILEQQLQAMKEKLVQAIEEKREAEELLKDSKLKRGFTIKNESPLSPLVKRLDLNESPDRNNNNVKKHSLDLAANEKKSRVIVDDDEGDENKDHILDASTPQPKKESKSERLVAESMEKTDDETESSDSKRATDDSTVVGKKKTHDVLSKGLFHADDDKEERKRSPMERFIPKAKNSKVGRLNNENSQMEKFKSSSKIIESKNENEIEMEAGTTPQPPTTMSAQKDSSMKLSASHESNDESEANGNENEDDVNDNSEGDNPDTSEGDGNVDEDEEDPNL